MIDLEFVTLEDNIEYIILDEIVIDDNKYLYLVNSMNSNDFVIRKEIGNELVGLDDKVELYKVLDVFIRENYELLEKNISDNINSNE